MQNNKIEIFQLLSKEFKDNGFKLFLVGGSTRDYLLGKQLTDMDVCTDATPSEMKLFLKSADYTFEKYGSVKIMVENVKFDITTLRKEKNYIDSRHPSIVQFATKLEEDVKRRDLTINALYMDSDLNVIDLVGGIDDINNKLIRFIGDPLTRITEDPLRIVRALRFSLDLSFDIENYSKNVIFSNFSLLNRLNPDKINSEINKCENKINLINILKVIK